MTELNALIRDIPRPPRIARLKVSDRGFPIPWFTHIEPDGTPNFTAVDPSKIVEAYRHQRCWICGDVLGVYQTFVLGPMCVVNRTTAEPASHFTCAQYAAKACPFLINPNAKRNAKALPEEHQPPPGLAIMRNPGVIALYTVRSYKPFKIDDGVLFRFGDPGNPIEWICQGRTATSAEVHASISGGLPLLHAEAERQGAEAIAELNACIAKAQPLFPA